MSLVRGVQIYRTGDQNVDRFQDQVRRMARELASIPILFGQAVTGVNLSTTATAVQHGLGRSWVGYFVTKRSTNATVWDSGPGQTPDKTLTLTASGNVTVDLWVF